jgi:hypothetical protein
VFKSRQRNEICLFSKTFNYNKDKNECRYTLTTLTRSYGVYTDNFTFFTFYAYVIQVVKPLQVFQPKLVLYDYLIYSVRFAVSTIFVVSDFARSTISYQN